LQKTDIVSAVRIYYISTTSCLSRYRYNLPLLVIKVLSTQISMYYPVNIHVNHGSLTHGKVHNIGL